MKTIGILGSTGSIGTQSLDVIGWFPEDYKVQVLVANHHWGIVSGTSEKVLPGCGSDLRRIKVLSFKGSPQGF